MGWFGTYADYETVAEYAKQELNWNGEQTKQLDQAVVNSNVYTLVEIIKGDKKGEIFISIDRVERKDGHWMHKGWDENGGPFAYDCPERILKRSNQTSQIAINWREKCRRMRRDKAERKRLVLLLKSGMIINSKAFGPLCFLYKSTKTGSKIACRDNLGSVFAYQLKDFSIEELNNAIDKG